MDQITLEECLIRTGLGGTSTKTIESITSPEAVQNDGPNGFNSYTSGTVCKLQIQIPQEIHA